MKSSKGKEFIEPDPDWLVSETKILQRKGKSNIKKFHIKKFNRKIRRFFTKLINNKTMENINDY